MQHQSEAQQDLDPHFAAALLSLDDAAAMVRPVDDLTPEDFALLRRAGESGAVESWRFAAIVETMRQGGPLHCATRTRFDDTMDYLFGHGFRDGELPEVGGDYIAFLDDFRRQLGLDDQAFGTILASAGVGEGDRQLTGSSFVLALHALCQGYRLPYPRLPPRQFMGRDTVGQIYRAVRALGLSYEQHVNVLITEGGGCLLTKELDRSGAQRVMARYLSSGYVEPEPAPRVEARPGYVTQPQVNLIWKLWNDDGVGGGDGLGVWLAVNGFAGGLDGLTAAGARRVLDELLGSVITRRLQR